MGGEREGAREKRRGSRGGAEHTQKIIEETGDAFLLQRRGKELGGGRGRGKRRLHLHFALHGNGLSALCCGRREGVPAVVEPDVERPAAVHVVLEFGCTPKT